MNGMSTRNEKIILTIYYKSQRTANSVIRNNPMPPPDTLQRTNAIYKYCCPHGDCKLPSSIYIGMTTTRLSRRLSYHLTNEAPRAHTRDVHNINITSSMLEKSTKILDTADNSRHLQILEAMMASRIWRRRGLSAVSRIFAFSSSILWVMLMFCTSRVCALGGSLVRWQARRLDS